MHVIQLTGKLRTLRAALPASLDDAGHGEDILQAVEPILVELPDV